MEVKVSGKSRYEHATMIISRNEYRKRFDEFRKRFPYPKDIDFFGAWGYEKEFNFDLEKQGVAIDPYSLTHKEYQKRLREYLDKRCTGLQIARRFDCFEARI
jgi:hypothetical protein